MQYLKYLSMAMAVVNAAKNGKVTIKEVTDFVGEYFPDEFDDIVDAVKDYNLTDTEGNKDSDSVPVMRVLDIVSSIID